MEKEFLLIFLRSLKIKNGVSIKKFYLSAKLFAVRNSG